MTGLHQDRKHLRINYRSIRNGLSKEQQDRAAAKVVANITALVGDEQATVAGYLANDGEVSLTPYFKSSAREHIIHALPVLHPFAKQTVLFQKFDEHTSMGLNRYKIPEPVLDCQSIIPINHIDVILMPLVAFDKSKNRLGMGGGYYDRTLAFWRDKTSRPKLVGIAHTEQCHEFGLPFESWDIPLDNVVTPDYTI